MFKRFLKKDGLNRSPYSIYRPKPTYKGKELKPKEIKPSKGPK